MPFEKGSEAWKLRENIGRKKAYEEHNKTNAINKLWEKVNNKVMEGEELTDFEKELVKAILPKTVKTETDITSGGKPIPLLGGLSVNKEDGTYDTGDKEVAPTEEED